MPRANIFAEFFLTLSVLLPNWYYIWQNYQVCKDVLTSDRFISFFVPNTYLTIHFSIISFRFLNSETVDYNGTNSSRQLFGSIDCHLLSQSTRSLQENELKISTRCFDQTMSREKLQTSFLPSSSTFLGLILWLPISQVEQSRCIRWFLVWLPSKLKACPTYPNQQLTKKYANYCLGVHQYLQIPKPINDPPVLPLEYTTALKSCSFRNTISSFFSVACFMQQFL